MVAQPQVAVEAKVVTETAGARARMAVTVAQAELVE